LHLHEYKAMIDTKLNILIIEKDSHSEYVYPLINQHRELGTFNSNWNSIWKMYVPISLCDFLDYLVIECMTISNIKKKK